MPGMQPTEPLCATWLPGMVGAIQVKFTMETGTIRK